MLRKLIYQSWKKKKRFLISSALLPVVSLVLKLGYKHVLLLRMCLAVAYILIGNVAISCILANHYKLNCV